MSPRIRLGSPRVVSDRRAEIVDVKEKAIEADRPCKAIERPPDRFETIAVIGRLLYKAEARQVRRHYACDAGERPDDVSKAVRGIREPVKQKETGASTLPASR